MVTVNYSAEVHYEMLCDWWQRHGWNCPPADFLSSDGCVVSSDKGFHAAGFLWQDKGNGFAVIDMLVTNPENRMQLSAASLKQAITHLKGLTEAKYIMAMCRQAALARLLCMTGDFKKADDGVTHLICVR